MGSREDDDWFNVKYAEASCHEHGPDEMYFDEDAGEHFCQECINEDEPSTIYKRERSR